MAAILYSLVRATALAIIIFALIIYDHEVRIDRPLFDDVTDIAKPIRVSCVGDSITAGVCASADNMTYVGQLSRLLGSRYNVTNYGDSGKTMLKDGLCASAACSYCESPCAYWDTDTMDAAMQSDPDMVTIMLGTNDAKYCNWYGSPNGSPTGLGVEFRSAYLDMISLFKSLPTRPKVYVVIPPPLVHPPKHPGNPPPYNMTPRVLNVILPIMIRGIALESGADGVIDTWSALGGTDEYEDDAMTCDGCHPKDAAYTIIAKSFATVLREGAREEGMHVDALIK